MNSGYSPTWARWSPGSPQPARRCRATQTVRRCRADGSKWRNAVSSTSMIAKGVGHRLGAWSVYQQTLCHANSYPSRMLPSALCVTGVVAFGANASPGVSRVRVPKQFDQGYQCLRLLAGEAGGCFIGELAVGEHLLGGCQDRRRPGPVEAGSGADRKEGSQPCGSVRLASIMCPSPMATT